MLILIEVVFINNLVDNPDQVVINTKNIIAPLILFLNLNENDNRGSLEIHKSGCFMSQYKYDGILSLNDYCTDCIFNADNANDIVAYLEHYIYNYGNGWK